MSPRPPPRAEPRGKVTGFSWQCAGLARAGIVVLGLAAGGAVARAADVGQGITVPVVLPPFNETAPACSAPPGLGASLAFVQDNSRKFIEGAGEGLAQAARDRGLAYQALVADNDPQKQAAEIETLIAAKTGAIVTPPVDPGQLAPLLKQAIASGAYVGTIVPPPATTILNAPQYLTGKVLGEAAADYIRTKLQGKAHVVLLTQDSMQFLAARFTAIRDVLKDLPEVNIIADISPNPVIEEGGYETMKLVLLAHPKVDV